MYAHFIYNQCTCTCVKNVHKGKRSRVSGLGGLGGGKRWKIARAITRLMHTGYTLYQEYSSDTYMIFQRSPPPPAHILLSGSCTQCLNCTPTNLCTCTYTSLAIHKRFLQTRMPVASYSTMYNVCLGNLIFKYQVVTVYSLGAMVT